MQTPLEELIGIVVAVMAVLIVILITVVVLIWRAVSRSPVVQLEGLQDRMEDLKNTIKETHNKIVILEERTSTLPRTESEIAKIEERTMAFPQSFATYFSRN